MYKYVEEHGFHYLDYRTYITMDIGLRRLEQLDEYFSSIDTPQDSIKILMDARDFKYDSEETHLKMSKMGRDLLSGKFANVILATINDKYEVKISEFEAWFVTKESAITWLSKKV